MDASWYQWINRFADRTNFAHGFFRAYAGAGVVVFAALLLITFLDGRLHGRSDEVAGSVWAGAAALIALEIGQWIGTAIDRARPYESLPNVHVLVSRTTDFSFPSDHATMAGAVAVGLLFANRRWGIVASMAAVLMAFTRVYVGAHYPSDVLAGLALGGLVAATGAIWLVPLIDRGVRRLATTPAGWLVTSRPILQNP